MERSGSEDRAHHDPRAPSRRDDRQRRGPPGLIPPEPFRDDEKTQARGTRSNAHSQRKPNNELTAVPSPGASRLDAPAVKLH